MRDTIKRTRGPRWQPPCCLFCLFSLSEDSNRRLPLCPPPRRLNSTGRQLRRPGCWSVLEGFDETERGFHVGNAAAAATGGGLFLYVHTRVTSGNSWCVGGGASCLCVIFSLAEIQTKFLESQRNTRMPRYHGGQRREGTRLVCGVSVRVYVCGQQREA